MCKRLFVLLMVILVLVGCFGLSISASGNSYGVNGVYIGVENYGSLKAVDKHNFVHKFSVDGIVQSFRIRSNDFAIQNSLIEGDMYSLSVNNGLIVDSKESLPISQGVVSMVIGKDIYVEGVKLNLNSDYKGYEVVNSAGGARVSSKIIGVGDYVRVYDQNAVYAFFKPFVYSSPVNAVAGQKTLKNFIKTSMMPVGSTLYVYGGGWDYQDKGSSNQAKSIGISESWTNFFAQQDANYAYRSQVPSKSFYPTNGYNQYYYVGLDCSGYVGWAIYNTFNIQNGQEGFVSKSTSMAKSLADKGYGTWSYKGSAKDFRSGDIFSMNGHVWINLGKCNDGSMVILHSSPSPSINGSLGGGVQLSAIGNGYNCEAYVLASDYMKRYYPKWSERYNVMLKGFGEYTKFSGGSTGRFSWNINDSGLLDPDGYKDMSADEILKDLSN